HRLRGEFTGPYLIVLSARTQSSLSAQCLQLSSYLSTRGASLSLASVAYTLQQGRAALSERLALIADDMTSLIEELKRYHRGETGRYYTRTHTPSSAE
ncbi:hypothetical protein, partial [Fulvivirga kasyanovii]|uniref:KS-MAT linker domain-containing protein n=1 Tax=Fulvivirga kasyanovii TaxID=396812 RepID=UPI0031D7F017